MGLASKNRIVVSSITLSLILFFLISRNAFNFLLERTDGHITLHVENTAIPLEFPQSVEKEIVLTPVFQTRHSSGQAMVVGESYLQGSLKLICRVLSGFCNEAKPGIRAWQSSAHIFVWNPFRFSVRVLQERMEYRLSVSIPDGAVEVYEGPKKIKTVPLSRGTWLRLILSGILLPLCMSFFLLSIVSWLPDKKKAIGIITAARNPRYIWLVFVALFCIGFYLIWDSFTAISEKRPGFGDEMNYLFQGKIFSEFKTSVPEPELRKFFEVGWMDLFGRDGKIWGFHPPGNSILLALGWLVGCYWITVPIVAGLIIAAIYWMARIIIKDDFWALIAALVAISSHYFVTLASSFMAHAPSLLCITLFNCYWIRFIQQFRTRDLNYAAVYIGLAFVIRPLGAALSLVVPAIYILWKSRKRLRFEYLISILIFVSLASIVFWYTYSITEKFSLSYFVKGPEVGKNLWKRLTSSDTEHLKNLYRSFNEIVHRIHSYGLAGNFLFFFIPLISIRTLPAPTRPIVKVLYITFFFFVVAHSLLHWYGWKWEPRMLYDATACYFVLTAYGMKILFDRLPRFLDYIVGILCLTLLGHALVVDLPYRLKTEYFNYNGFQLDAYQEIEKYGIRNAIIFFNTEEVYSKYMAFNSITFDGDLIYALSQGSERDAELISRFPEKRVLYFDTNSPERKLKESPNFYRTDLKLLEQYIYSLSSSVPNANIYAVTPWEPYSSIKLSKIHNLAVFDPINIYNSFVLRTSGPSDYIFLFDRATGLENILTHFYELETLSGPPFESKHRLFRIIKPVSFPAKEIPGVLFRCYRGVKLEESKVFLQTVIPCFDISPCISEDTSMSWAAQFRLKNSLIFKMDLRSDDGAAVYIDDEMVLNNGFFEKEGVRRTAKTIQLSPGTHSISVKYFNGPGPYKFELLINGMDITKDVFLLEETSESGFYVSMDELQVQNALHR